MKGRIHTLISNDALQYQTQTSIGAPSFPSMKTNIVNDNFTGFHAHSETRSLNMTIGLQLLRHLHEVSRGLDNHATPVDLQYPLLFDSILLNRFDNPFFEEHPSL